MSFRGDGDIMVDALIKASEEQKCVSAEPLPGAGRDLVPFDFEAHNHHVDGNNSNTPLLVGVDPRLRAHQVCAPQVPTGGHAAAAAKLSNSAPLEATAKGNNNNKGKSNKNKNNNRNDDEPKYAGASFTNSPDPDVVPLPSFLKTIPGAQAAMARRNSSHNSLSSSAGSSPPTTTTANANNLMQNLLSRSPPPPQQQQHQQPPMSGQALLGSLLGGGTPAPPQHHHQHKPPPPTPSVLNDLFGGNRNGGVQLQPYRGPDGSQQYPNIPEPANHDFQMMMAKLSGSQR